MEGCLVLDVQLYGWPETLNRPSWEKESRRGSFSLLAIGSFSPISKTEGEPGEPEEDENKNTGQPTEGFLRHDSDSKIDSNAVEFLGTQSNTRIHSFGF